MQNVTRTVYGSYLQTCQYLNERITILPFTTLNEKLGILKDSVMAEGEVPAVKYIAIGNKGHKFSIGAEGVAKTEELEHRPTDAALYNQIPFVLRPASSDLTPSERAKYALRKEVTVSGDTYIAYYLKRIPASTSSPEMVYKSVYTDPATNTTNTVFEAFVPSSRNLNPEPPDLTNNAAIATTGDYVSSTAKISLDLSPEEVQEILDACNILYGDPAYAIISEIAICSGVDRVYSLDYNGVVSNYAEANFVQICSFIFSMISLQHSVNGVKSILDIGSTEPLFMGK
jgi:hypothetical protein